MLAYCKLKPLTLIKILRPMLPTRRAQQHLTDCAAYEALFRVFEPYRPPLRLSHVLGLRPLPRRTGAEIIAHPRFHGVNRAIAANDRATCPDQPVA